MAIPFSLDRFPVALHPLLSPERLPELGPGRPDSTVHRELESLKLDELFPEIQDPIAAQASLAGLWLLHDFLDESHAISQEIHTAEGSYWHAIMHRREPDAWNSKYWFRQVGNHPVMKLLQSDAARYGYSYRSPDAFVDFCEAHRGRGDESEQLARQIQRLEWDLLFAYCYDLARFGRVS